MELTRHATKLGLITGYLGLLVGVLAAHDAPATAYELSLYAATPVLTWLGLGVAGLVSTLVLVAGDRESRAYDGGLLLAALLALTVLALPLVRGYWFYGAGDALSHVGWAREIAAGSLAPSDLLYPGIHSLTVAIAAVAGVPLTQANMYVVLVVFPLIYLLFVPLTAWLIAGTRDAIGIGLLTAILFAPINNVSVHPIAHPASQTILFVPFVLYLALRYVAGTDRGRLTSTSARSTVLAPGTRALLRGLPGSAFGVVLGLTAAALVLLHPQQALNVTLIFGAITVFQFGASRWGPGGIVANDRPLHVQTAIIVVAFLLWAPRFARVRGAIVSTFGSIIGQGPTTGEVVGAKSASLTVLGGSIVVLFLKLFLPALVVSLLAAGLILLVFGGRLGDDRESAFVRYIAIALVPIFGVFLVVLIAASGDMYFRYEGFMMVPLTILAAVALVHIRDRLGVHRTRRVATVAVVVLFLVLIPAGVVAVHDSPYMYQPTQHVPESRLAGYQAAFEHRDPGIEFTGIRGGPRRYVDFHYGTELARTTLDFPGYEDGIGEDTFRNASYAEIDDPRYLSVTQAAYEREVRLFSGFRYPASGFQALESTPGVNRIRTNGEYTLYLVDTAES